MKTYAYQIRGMMDSRFTTDIPRYNSIAQICEALKNASDILEFRFIEIVQTKKGWRVISEDEIKTSLGEHWRLKCPPIMCFS